MENASRPPRPNQLFIIKALAFFCMSNTIALCILHAMLLSARLLSRTTRPIFQAHFQSNSAAMSSTASDSTKENNPPKKSAIYTRTGDKGSFSIALLSSNLPFPSSNTITSSPHLDVVPRTHQASTALDCSRVFFGFMFFGAKTWPSSIRRFAG